MAQSTALKLALEIYHMPARVRSARAEPLHDGVHQLLLIAAGDEEAERQASEQLERPQELLKEAAAFYIEQILLAPDADAYRVLGADRDAPLPELRRNMALLLRFLHPDHDKDGKRSMFAGKVISAWDELKSPERRSQYDAALAERHERKLQRAATNSAKPMPVAARWNGIPRASDFPVHVAPAPQLHADRRGLLSRALHLLWGRKS